MNDILRERLIRKLDTLPEEKIYQILDYIDFLESKYAPKVSAAPNPLKRFAEGVEDTLRASSKPQTPPAASTPPTDTPPPPPPGDQRK